VQQRLLSYAKRSTALGYLSPRRIGLDPFLPGGAVGNFVTICQNTRATAQTRLLNLKIISGNCVFDHECGLQMIQPGKTPANTIACFFPESDVVTLIRILALLLADRSHDFEYLEQFSIHPSILDHLRSDVNELIHFLDLTPESLFTFCKLNPMELVDSIVSFIIIHFPMWCDARRFHSVETLPQTDFDKFCPSLFEDSEKRRALLDFRPGRPNSSVPYHCLSFSSFCPLNEEKCIILMIHRNPRAADRNLAIAGEELISPSISPWLLRLVEVDLNVGKDIFFTTNDMNTHVNYRTTRQNVMSLLLTSIQRMSQILRFVPRSVLY
jgi:hypothetical protein